MTESVKKVTETSFVSSPCDLSILEPGLLYVINDTSGTTYKIEALKFKTYKKDRIKRRNKNFGFYDKKEIDKTIRSTLYNNKIFTVDKNEFNKKVKRPNPAKERFNVGLLTLPFKYRPDGNKTFNTEFNLSSTLNVRLKSFYTTDFYLQIGAGIGSVGLSSANSSGITDNSSVDAAILTGLTGLMLQYNKVQAGIYVGWDYLNNQKQNPTKSYCLT